MNTITNPEQLAHFLHTAAPGQTFTPETDQHRITTLTFVRRHTSPAMPGQQDTIQLTETTTSWDPVTATYAVTTGMAMAWLDPTQTWDPQTDLESITPLQNLAAITSADTFCADDLAAIHACHTPA